MFGPTPCEKCNGAGYLNRRGEPLREWEVIKLLLVEIKGKDNQIHLLKRSSEQKVAHDGVNPVTRYRGD